MSTLTSSFTSPVMDLYRYILSKRDPRTMGWSLSGDPKFMFPVIFAYLYIVKIGGPRWMMNRKPFQNLKPVIMAYNFAMVVTNSIFFVLYLRHSYLGGGYNLFCQGVTYSRDDNTMALLNLTWWYIFVRIADFFDTIFFLLRKKFSHITVLHVVHHTLVVFSGWLWITFGCDGQVLLGICFNSFIHIIMYSYYFLAALGPSVQKYLWWKKYLTRLQILQFIILTIHVSIPMFYDCGYPMILTMLATAQGMLGLVLFINFYINAYYRKSTQTNFCTLQEDVIDRKDK
ncbi:very long chain fatty acid elongase AAEL008004-like [Ornithodoros turicata]|uniref:very long chain fatty acid elongase AAEL008004-like n=1 Tax=Ornithodoros turicata TaxID=34597 RepID=UPI0031387AAC